MILSILGLLQFGAKQLDVLVAGTHKHDGLIHEKIGEKEQRSSVSYLREPHRVSP